MDCPLLAYSPRCGSVPDFSPASPGLPPVRFSGNMESFQETCEWGPSCERFRSKTIRRLADGGHPAARVRGPDRRALSFPADPGHRLFRPLRPAADRRGRILHPADSAASGQGPAECGDRFRGGRPAFRRLPGRPIRTQRLRPLPDGRRRRALRHGRLPALRAGFQGRAAGRPGKPAARRAAPGGGRRDRPVPGLFRLCGRGLSARHSPARLGGRPLPVPQHDRRLRSARQRRGGRDVRRVPVGGTDRGGPRGRPGTALHADRPGGVRLFRQPQ